QSERNPATQSAIHPEKPRERPSDSRRLTPFHVSPEATMLNPISQSLRKHLSSKRHRAIGRAVGRAAASARVVACEFLENRLMFITTTFDGTSGTDNISVSIVGNNIHGTVNGVIDDRSDTIFNNIEVDGLGGNDTITI